MLGGDRLLDMSCIRTATDLKYRKSTWEEENEKKESRVRHGLNYHLYADDTQLYFAFKSVDVDATKSRVENCISATCRWKDLNELKLNHDKTRVMLIHSKYRPSLSFQSLCVGDDSVAASQSARSLGIIIDEHVFSCTCV